MEEKPPENDDPFAASERINKPEELLTGSGFKKDKDVSNDVTAGLSELTVVPVDTGTTTIKGVEGFEGDYGSLDYDPADGGFGDAFEGLTDAFGGGLDPAEFGAVTERQKRLDAGLGGLEELEGGGGKKATPGTAENGGDSSGSKFVGFELFDQSRDFQEIIDYWPIHLILRASRHSRSLSRAEALECIR